MRNLTTSPVASPYLYSPFSTGENLYDGYGFGSVDHSQLGRVKYRVWEMGRDPDGQVGQTLRLMWERVKEDAQDPGFRGRALALFDGAGSERGVVERIWENAKRGIRFQRDEVTGNGVGGYGQDEVVEVIVRPQDMARFIDQGEAVGDCDDFSMYIAANLMVFGIPCTFVTVAADSRDPNQFSHVYVAAYPLVGDVDGHRERVAVDASHGGYCGWEVRGYGRMREWGLGSGFWDGFLGSLAAGVVLLWVGNKLGVWNGRLPEWMS